MSLKLPNTFGLAGWLVVALVALLIVVGGWWLITEPGRQRERAGRAEAAATMADARTGAARDAVTITQGNHAETEETRARIEEGTHAIRTADPDDRDAVALRELCRSPLYRDQARCRVQQPHP